eukprot:TRINITY_DN30743_c0_g1_i1.p1 TRINITY_DN30743_c0_g1~~TRINITY_DN30743_c0_g1_i1.p1  ORF type:complete len:262 (-),score=31.43 TRINITY_DN30743_c0_g1_i1:38-823(-)
MDAHAPKGQFMRTKMCKFYLGNACTRGEACHFAHGEKDLNELPDFSKTRLCHAYVTTGRCQDASACQFAHSKKEMQHAAKEKGRLKLYNNAGPPVPSFLMPAGSPQSPPHQTRTTEISSISLSHSSADSGSLGRSGGTGFGKARLDSSNDDDDVAQNPNLRPFEQHDQRIGFRPRKPTINRRRQGKASQPGTSSQSLPDPRIQNLTPKLHRLKEVVRPLLSSLTVRYDFLCALPAALPGAAQRSHSMPPDFKIGQSSSPCP